MKQQSHLALGRHLAKHFLEQWPNHFTAAFLLGCIQPDKNPVTYLKGSLRSQLLRGHNWDNSRIYIQKLCHRLEARQAYRPSDAYALGKLMHYLADAFTYVHNAPFCTLSDHRAYEARLESYFLNFMRCPILCQLSESDTVYETIAKSHMEYIRQAGSVHTDACFAFSLAFLVMAKLTAEACQSTPV